MTYLKKMKAERERAKLSDKDLEVLVKVLFSDVEWRKVERGIAVRPVNVPAAERIVEIPSEVRDSVWEWLHNPIIVGKEEWVQLRGPILAVITEVAEIILQYGSLLQREVFKRKIEELLKSNFE